MQVISLGLRGLQLLFSVIVLAISGAMAHQTVFGGSPSQINFSVFVGAFSMLALFYFIFDAVTDNGIGMASLVLDALLVLFTFAAGIAMAVKMHVHSCGNHAYTNANSITNGAPNTTGRCHEGQALTVFLWFLFATYLVTVLFSAKAAKSGGMRIGRGGGARGGPSMSQV